MYPRLFLRSGHHTNGLINTKISFNKTYVDISLRCALSNFLQILERGIARNFFASPRYHPQKVGVTGVTAWHSIRVYARSTF